jgi:hypothetical protein
MMLSLLVYASVSVLGFVVGFAVCSAIILHAFKGIFH